jgi:hypothetical protein
VIASQAEHPAVDVLRVLAVSRSSGSLEIRGTPGGTFFLHEGDVTFAEVVGIPPVLDVGGADWRLSSAIRETIIDTGLALLTGPDPDAERPLFRPGRRHWTSLICQLEVEWLLAEIARRLTDFTGLGVEPDDDVRLCSLRPGRAVVLDREQWVLAARMSGPQTARSLAWRSGIPIGATISNLASLVAAGVAQSTTGADAAAPASPAAASVKAHEESPAPVSEPTAPLEMRLPRRVRGATLPPSDIADVEAESISRQPNSLFARPLSPAPVDESGLPLTGEPSPPLVHEPGLPLVDELGPPLAGEPGLPPLGEPGRPLVDESGPPLAGEPGLPLVDEPELPPVGEPKAAQSMDRRLGQGRSGASPRRDPPAGEPDTPSVPVPKAWSMRDLSADGQRAIALRLLAGLRRI